MLTGVTETTMDQDLTMQFPRQAYYNLIVYDLPTQGVREMFASSDDVHESVLLEMCEKGLDYIKDRLAEGSHSNEDDELPNTERLLMVKDVLETQRAKIFKGEPDLYFDEEEYL